VFLNKLKNACAITIVKLLNDDGNQFTVRLQGNP
jgi:hypothetical protein